MHRQHACSYRGTDFAITAGGLAAYRAETGSFTPDGFTSAARCITSTSNTKDRRAGWTHCVVVVGNVVVRAFTSVAGDRDHGDDMQTIRLAHAGIAHRFTTAVTAGTAPAAQRMP